METDEQNRPDSFPDNEIMLSSAEDLNIDGGFMGPAPELDRDHKPSKDDELEREVNELIESEDDEEPVEENYEFNEPEPEPVPEPVEESHEFNDHESEFNSHESEFNNSEPEFNNPAPEPVVNFGEINDEEKPDEPEEIKVEIDLPKEEEKLELHKEKAPRPKSGVVSAHSYRGVNKMALAWMIILTIILGGVIGVMLYAFILNQAQPTTDGNAEPDTSLQGNLSVVAGALEVYLTDVNLDNYNSDIILVNNGGTITLRGKLNHTVFINSSSAATVVLKNVTINSPDNAALVNINKNDLVLNSNGVNSFYGTGGKYGAALYSFGKLSIKGDGRTVIYSSGESSVGIKTEDGYQVNSGTVIAMAQGMIEVPAKDSAQTYFIKDLARVYAGGTIVSAADENGKKVVEFTAPGEFMTIFVSNSELEDGMQYSIDLGSNKAE